MPEPEITINFKVEDGTPYSDSTSYASVDQFKQYWIDKGTTFSEDIEDETIEAYLNLATEWLDNNYRFKGFKTKMYDPLVQALEWPRVMVNPLGEALQFSVFRSIESDEIPIEIINATCFMALQAKN